MTKFDNIFLNIEYHIRELGYGDVAVNKKMKTLSKIFYDILFNIEKNDNDSFFEIDNLLIKYFFAGDKKNEKLLNLSDYLSKFKNFCFALDINIMLNGSIDFKYR